MSYLIESDDKILQGLLNRIGDLMEADSDRNDEKIKAMVGTGIVPYMVSQGMCELVVAFPNGGSMALTIRNNRAEMNLLIPGKAGRDN